MRRKPFTLVPMERTLLMAAIDLFHRGTEEFHGYALAREVAELTEARRLTGHGTLYRALDRMEQAGVLESRLEDADDAATERRPRRRLYRVTAAGEAVAANESQATPRSVSFKQRLATK